MASLAMLAGGALINALAFSGTNFLFHKLSAGDEERKRHDLALEKYTRDYHTWLENRQNRLDLERKRRLAAQTSEKHMQELDQSMVEYARALDAQNPKPQFFQYYHPSEAQKKKDYLGALVAIGAIGGIAYYVL